MNNNTKFFVIRGTKTYGLITSNLEDVEAYDIVNVKTGNIVKKYVNPVHGTKSCGITLNGKFQKLSNLVWKNVPYFKALEKEIEAMSIAIPNFPNFRLLPESKQVWNGNDHKFVKSWLNPNGTVYFDIWRRNKAHRFTFNQIVWIANYKEQLNKTDCVISSNFFKYGENTSEKPENLIKVSKLVFRQLVQYKKQFDHGKKDVEYFFDIIDTLDLPTWKKEKLQLGILDKYC